jgi:hypothetical protein
VISGYIPSFFHDLADRGLLDIADFFEEPELCHAVA